MDGFRMDDSVLSGLDVTIFAASILLSVLIGLYFANKNDTMEDYMLGGRNQRLLPVAVSMMTSFTSGISIIGYPSEFYYQGFAYMTIPITSLLSIPVTALIMLPVFHRMGTVSIYDYLAKRFHPLVKLLVSLSFMIQMTLYNAVVLFVPSLSLQTILGISPAVSIGAVGTCCLIYSTLGGIKAIIWTDFFQAGLMYLSVLCIAIGGTIEAGGLANLIQISRDARKFDINGYFNLDLNTRHTLFTIILGGLVNDIFVNGTSQIQIQRALSLPSLRLAQWSMFLQGIFVLLITSVCLYLGLVMTAAYSGCDPLSGGQIVKSDSLIFYYLMHHLLGVPGLRGLFVAGIFAATLSTLSSFQNSMSALVIEDFIKPSLDACWGRPMSQRLESWLSRIIALCFGLTCIGLSFVVGKIAGILQVALTLFGALGAPLVGVFLVGMLTRVTNAIGITCGIVSGSALGMYVNIYQTFYLGQPKISMPMSLANCPANSSSLFMSTAQQSVIVNQLVEPVALLGVGRFLGMSYLWLPVFVLVTTMVVAIVVSIATGGLSQEVEDQYLVSWMQHKGICKLQGSFDKNKVSAG